MRSTWLLCFIATRCSALSGTFRGAQEPSEQASDSSLINLVGDRYPEAYRSEYGSMQSGGEQEVMLSDEIRVGSYFKAITSNPSDFKGKSVMDVGAGTGLLSFFSAQAGAKNVYSVEASRMAAVERALLSTNKYPGSNVTVLNSLLEKVNDKQVNNGNKVDVLVSEPLGSFLFHEQMITTYLVARDRFLKKGGKMFPKFGDLWVAPITDSIMYDEYTGQPVDNAATYVEQTKRFWSNKSFYGINLGAALEFVPDMPIPQPPAPPPRRKPQQSIVDLANPQSMVADPSGAAFNFETMSVDALNTIKIPLDFKVKQTGPIHGLVGWFDARFEGSDKKVLLSTAPWCPRTHWWHDHFLLESPLFANAGDHIEGLLTMRTNNRSSYDIRIDMTNRETRGTASNDLWLDTNEFRYISSQNTNYNYVTVQAGDHRCVEVKPPHPTKL